jgi:N-methylhydantoinase B
MTTATVLDVELARSRLSATVGELTHLLYRSAYSTLMRESRDCSFSLLSHRGEVLVDRPGPFHGSSYHYLVARILERFSDSIAPGDVFMTNHPYDSGIPHTPDLALVIPSFLGDRLVGFSASIAHKSDFGGAVIGSASMEATQLYQEGLLLPLVRVATAERPELDPGVLAIIAGNVRTADLFFGDMRAQLGVTRLGAERLAALAERTGVNVLQDCFSAMVDQGEQAVRSAVSAWPDGQVTVTGYIDSDGINRDVPVKLEVTVTIEGDRIVFDLTGCADQTTGPINMTRMFGDSAVFYTMVSCATPDFGFNDGIRRAVEIRRRPGSLLDPQFPAPVGAATSHQHRLIDLCFEALGILVPGIGGAHSGGSGGTIGIEWHASGHRSFQYEVLGTAMGAVHDRDGVDGVTVYGTNLTITPVEVLENQYPVRITRFELIQDSGGAGRFRGGMSYRREYEALEPASVRRRAERGKFPSHGVNGGHHGKVAKVTIRHPDGTVEQVHVAGRYDLQPHDVLTIEGSGAGGFGDPRGRPAELVLADVRAGLVSIGSAAADYGVVITEQFEIDQEATGTARGGDLA